MIVCSSCVLFFFCKQKTAYEMRISDWSSDVCSSDLLSPIRAMSNVREPRQRTQPREERPERQHRLSQERRPLELNPEAHRLLQPRPPGAPHQRHRSIRPLRSVEKRSEEHTSELQSLMRISYAVFCLKKKKTTIRRE